MRGRVKWFDAGKGYGFITGEDGTEYLVYYTALQGSEAEMKENASVEFEPVIDTPKGPQASNVHSRRNE